MAELFFAKVFATNGVAERVGELAETYQEAFAAAPWNERTKCMQQEASSACPDGFSALALGELCATCSLCVEEIAHPAADVEDRFRDLSDDLTAQWYIEETGDRRVGLAVLSRCLTIEDIAKKQYGGDEVMSKWLTKVYGDDTDKRVIWLEEVFANTDIRPKGNLKNFGTMCRRLAAGPDVEEVAFRTVNPKLVRAAQRDFPQECSIADPVFEEIPDRRKFVRIALK